MAAVGPIAGLPTAPPVGAPSGAPKSDGGIDFADALASAIGTASDAEQVADQMAVDFAAGKDVGIHETIIAAEKANVHVRLAVSLKNKLLDAYRELMNTQV